MASLRAEVISAAGAGRGRVEERSMVSAVESGGDVSEMFVQEWLICYFVCQSTGLYMF